MTELYIDGQLAALPEGLNFTFTSENPYLPVVPITHWILIFPCQPIMLYSNILAGWM